MFSWLILNLPTVLPTVGGTPSWPQDFFQGVNLNYISQHPLQIGMTMWLSFAIRILSLSGTFFTWLFCFQLQNFCFVLFLRNKFSIFVDIVYLMRHCRHTFLYFLNCALPTAPTFLNVFIMVTLKSLSVESDFWVLSKAIFVFCFTFLGGGHTFLFLCKSYVFCWKLDILGNML